jgi:hypothetical protein
MKLALAPTERVSRRRFERELIEMSLPAVYDRDDRLPERTTSALRMISAHST